MSNSEAAGASGKDAAPTPTQRPGQNSPGAATVQPGPTRDAPKDNWLTALRDDEVPETFARPESATQAARVAAPTLPPPLSAPPRKAPLTPSQPPAAPSPAPASAAAGMATATGRWPTVVRVLAAIVAVETIFGLGYFLFRPKPPPAIFRLSKADASPEKGAAGVPALRREIIVSPKGDGQVTTIAEAIGQ